MIEKIFIVLLIVCPGILMILLLLIVFRRLFLRSGGGADRPPAAGRFETLSSGIARLHQVIPQNDRNLHNLQKKSFDRSSFRWADHPSLVTDAVENGWPRFAFTTSVTFPAKSGPSILGFRGNDDRVEIGWEICHGSSDYLQKIRFNPGMKNPVAGSGAGAGHYAIRAALPLPGPPLENLGFPQEAYFEITILPGGEIDLQSETDTIKLIQDEQNPDAVVSHGGGGGHCYRRSNVEEALRNEDNFLSVGLTAGGPFPMKLPGSFPGSIGFNSGGSVYLEGKKLVPESEDREWRKSGAKVIGCGYNPSRKTVFFTVDSQLAHIINCRSDAFGSPLYPTLGAGAGADVTVVVNLGQTAFEFSPANSRRTPNPCFSEPTTGSGLSYEDSKELFSMGRIDSQWRMRNRSNGNTVMNGAGRIKSDGEEDVDDEDLFEIALDMSALKSSAH
ncbi:uncharacterized protein LOC127265188 [Andrographis paniculata]|uniref:uncharacterized protein LOC127265188 n=1 Tax=Andrographis paniculata TaxID=175694 RepID=UPI0021E7F5B3|nr:uncharacterized protein LOC127265188 [Andrographis paniculata]